MASPQKYQLTAEHKALLPMWRDRWIANAMSVAEMSAHEQEICRTAVNGMYSAINLPPPQTLFAAGLFTGVFLAAVKNYECAQLGDSTTTTIGEPTDAPADLTKWYVIPPIIRAGIQQRRNAAMGTDRAVLDDVIKNVDHMRAGGNQWSGQDCYLTFFQDIVKFDLPEYKNYNHWRALAEHSGRRWTHTRFCVITDRPERLLVDSAKRPHSNTGPFCRWRDGSALYAVHGVRLPGWIIETPGRITLAAIEAEPNTEIARVMIERFGWERYIAESNATVIDHDERWGTLYAKGEMLFVKVINRSPEPDGGFRAYVLPVAPNCEPLPRADDPRGVLGAPQARTALNAVASTFGKTGEEYAALLGEES